MEQLSLHTNRGCSGEVEYQHPEMRRMPNTEIVMGRKKRGGRNSATLRRFRDLRGRGGPSRTVRLTALAVRCTVALHSTHFASAEKESPHAALTLGPPLTCFRSLVVFSVRHELEQTRPSNNSTPHQIEFRVHAHHCRAYAGLANDWFLDMRLLLLPCSPWRL